MSNNTQNQSVTDKIPDDLLITLKRTTCYGTCPSYTLTVESDGSVLFEGDKFTKVEGKAEGEIGEDKVKELIKEFNDADYFNLNGKYDCYQWTDDFSVVTSIQINGESKSIDHYHGCQEGDDSFVKELAKLTKLEDRIDEIVETKRWVGEQK